MAVPSYAAGTVRVVEEMAGLIVVMEEETEDCALLNEEGETIIPMGNELLSLHPIAENVVGVEKGGGRNRFALCNSEGLITDFEYDYLAVLEDADMPILVAVGEAFLHGYIDLKGEWVIPPEWDAAEPFSEGLALVSKGDDIGYINTTGELEIRLEGSQWLTAESFSEGLAAVKTVDELWGYIDQAGNVQIPCIYQEAWEFSDGLAHVVDEKGEFYIDHQGVPQSEARWKATWGYEYGYAVVRTEGGQEGVLDVNGDFVIAPSSDINALEILPNHQVWLEKRSTELWGLYDLAQGRMIMSFEWEIPTMFVEGFCYENGAYIVMKDGLYGILSENGEVLIPPVYDAVYFHDEGGVVTVSGNYRTVVELRK